MHIRNFTHGLVCFHSTLASLGFLVNPLSTCYDWLLVYSILYMYCLPSQRNNWLSVVTIVFTDLVELWCNIQIAFIALLLLDHAVNGLYCLTVPRYAGGAGSEGVLRF